MATAARKDMEVVDYMNDENWLYRCKVCKAVRRITRTVRVRGQRGYRETFGYINTVRSSYQDTNLKAFYDATHCCDRHMSGKAIQGSVTDHECDARCMAAKGHICECSCGGANHGVNYIH